MLCLVYRLHSMAVVTGYLTEKDQTVPCTVPLQGPELFPELVAQEGKEGAQLLAVVAGLSHWGPWRWGQRGLRLAGDLLEDLSFVEEDWGGAGGHVQQEAGSVLLDPSDGELHRPGTGQHLGPAQG